MAAIPEPERSKIYTRIKHQLGAPLRSVELEDEMLDSLMELAIGDYEEYILQWLIDSQWVNLVNLNMNERSVARALVTRTMDFEQQFSYSYSKIVGLQTEGPWVLKKDYFILSANTQTYEIPAGREVNELLWFSNQAWTAFGLGGLGGFGFGGIGLGANEAGYAQMGYQGSYFMMSGFDYLIRMQEANILTGQQWVRRWFTAYCKETLARVRGKYSGNLKTPDSEITMDYQSLLTEAKDEKSKLIEELIGAEGWLTRMRPDKVMEREALIAENLNKQMKFRAMPRQIYVI